MLMSRSTLNNMDPQTNGHLFEGCFALSDLNQFILGHIVCLTPVRNTIQFLPDIGSFNHFVLCVCVLNKTLNWKINTGY